MSDDLVINTVSGVDVAIPNYRCPEIEFWLPNHFGRGERNEISISLSPNASSLAKCYQYRRVIILQQKRDKHQRQGNMYAGKTGSTVRTVPAQQQFEHGGRGGRFPDSLAVPHTDGRIPQRV
jgi:hypothetical protein